MLEIVVLAMLVLVVAGSSVLAAAEKLVASRTWPMMPMELSKREPADEGASVPEGAPHIPDEEMRKAA